MVCCLRKLIYGCKITTALESHQPVTPHAMVKPWTLKDESFSWGEFATFKCAEDVVTNLTLPYN